MAESLRRAPSSALYAGALSDPLPLKEETMGERPSIIRPADGESMARFGRFFFVPEPCPAARMRLFCIPYAGSWPWVFRSWPASLPDVEVCVCWLPGRGQAQDPPAGDGLGSFVAALRLAMEPMLDKPYMIIGHSFGALVAFDLVGELERAGDPRPLRVFVSGCPTPSRFAGRPRLHDLSDEELTNVLREWEGTPSAVLGNGKLLKTTLALVRADLRMASEQPVRKVVVDCPITAFFGASDPQTSPRDVEEWRSHTRGAFDTQQFPGGHFFIHAQAAGVLSTLGHYVATSGRDDSFAAPADPDACVRIAKRSNGSRITHGG